MRADVILGITIDTPNIVGNLKGENRENIFIIDFDDNYGNKNEFGVKYISPSNATYYLSGFRDIYYYKSLYVYPGMSAQKKEG